jgi:hypothetical protein
MVSNNDDDFDIIVDIDELRENDMNIDDTAFKKAVEAQHLFKNLMLSLNKDGIVERDPETVMLINTDYPTTVVATCTSIRKNTPASTISSTPSMVYSRESGNTEAHKALFSSRTDSYSYSRPASVPARNDIFENAKEEYNNKDNNFSFKIDSETGLKIHNNWTRDNCNTIKNWKREIQKSSFIYETVKEQNNDKFQNVSNWSLVLNTIKLTTSAILAALLGISPNNTTVVWVGFCVSVFLFIMSGINTYLSGTVTIYKWDQRVNNISGFIQKLDSFYSTVSLQMNLSDRLRPDADEFITKHAEHYLQILQQIPDINPSEYFKANEMFKKYEADKTSIGYKCSQKYTV